MLHVHCGDAPAEGLRRSGVAGEIVVWSDILEQGPTPAGLSPEAWRAVRADFLAASSRGALDRERLIEHLRRQDEALARFRDHEEVVLWFDACMHDQATLIRHLDWFSSQDLGSTKLSLICIAHAGLGELMPPELAALLDSRQPIAADQLRLGSTAWRAWCSPDPREVERLAEKNTDALPYLHDALVRHLEQFPSSRNGLDRLQDEALQVVASGSSRLGEIFARVSSMEEQPWFGDTTLWSCLDGLASAANPALTVAGPGPLPLWDPPKDLSPWSVSATDTGLALLEGEAEWIGLNGIDRWICGVHLETGKVWRWNAEDRRLEPAGG